MANYCSNSIVFYCTERKPLGELWRKIKFCIDNREQNSVRNLLKVCGYTDEEAAENSDGRDCFAYLDNIERENTGVYYFKADTESAWTPNMDSFQKLLKEKYRGRIKMVYQSEEPGCGIFINSDRNGIFFTDRYRVDFYYKDLSLMEYFSSWTDALQVLRESFPKARLNACLSPDEAKRKIETAYRFTNKTWEYINIDCYQYSEDDEGGLAA